MRGYYFAPLAFITENNVKVFNVLTDQEVEGFNNGIGGYALKIRNGIYRVEMNVNGTICGYHFRLNYGQIGQAYNYFSK